MSRKQFTLRWLLCLVTAGTGFELAMARLASGAEKPYYEGKTLTILISSSPGGGTDSAGRLAAQFLPKYLPGNPKTIVKEGKGDANLF